MRLCAKEACLRAASALAVLADPALPVPDTDARTHSERVGAHIRATAIAVEIFVIHILGDAFSPTMMGKMADRWSLQAAFILPVIAMVISSAILFYGMKFAPAVGIKASSA